MHLALTLNPFVDTDLLYAQQLGVKWIVADVPAWDRATLAAAHNRVAKAGLQPAGLASLPAELVAQALAVHPEAGGAVERICRILADAGEVGIPCVSYRWASDGVPDATGKVQVRGGATSAVYRLQQAGATPGSSRDAAWERLTSFLQQVLPVAESAGVRLAYRTELVSGASGEDLGILDGVDELDRLFAVVGGPYHGLDLDHGWVTQVLSPRAGRSPEEIIGYLGRRGRIFAVRLRSLRMIDQGAQEVFPDEDRVATLRALQAYREAFDGPLCPMPAPAMTDDTASRHKGIAFSIGYLRALLQALDHHP